MAIETRYVEQTLEGDSQEFSIFGTADDRKDGIVRISCTIPVLARHWRPLLESGVEVINQTTGQLVEIHGILGKGVKPSLRKPVKRVYTPEQLAEMRARLQNARKK